MDRDGNGNVRRASPRYVFQVDSSRERMVLRVLDSSTSRVFREIPIEDFLDYARSHRNVTPFLLGQLPGAPVVPM